ncbi:hypothetical protein ZEAMMB73_Zm00001d033907 [Zea mays]|uniref:Inositol 1,3,4-trisphosphate 5/6-kinase ATP-grasp domain-containing protein n=1 Tax=Zea mays TaxID=4577 RepID=A0A1D6L373_MAIZE|nr:hypothetical protein ZEAMMB73_Zm00001d033907 [Zea mays]
MPLSELPPRPLLEILARELRRRLGLRLFDIDMIREHGTRDRFYVIDMNYFPGMWLFPCVASPFAGKGAPSPRRAPPNPRRRNGESPFFGRRTSILDTVTKVWSCVVMLDLECDDLINDMFHHFLVTVNRIIWLGGLNYRIALSYCLAKALVEMHKQLLEKDQIERRCGCIFQGCKEGMISFLRYINTHSTRIVTLVRSHYVASCSRPTSEESLASLTTDQCTIFSWLRSEPCFLAVAGMHSVILLSALLGATNMSLTNGQRSA